MFFKFFDWLKKRYEYESKKNFRKAEVDNATKVDNASGVDINTDVNIKTSGEIVKDLTDKVSNVNNINNDSVTKDLLNARERLNFAREKYYAANIAGKIIKKVLDKGIMAVQSNGITLGDLGGEGNIFVDFGKIYRLKGLKFMQKGVIVQSGVIEKLGDKGSKSWEIDISVPEFYEDGCCGKVIGWEERNIVGEFKKEIESVMNCEYEQNFRVINSGVCKFVSDEGLVRRVVKEAIWEEFGWNENGSVNRSKNEGRVNGENLSNENFGKVFFPKTGEWIDVRGKCKDVNGEFVGDVCREIVEGVKKFGVGRERFGIGNDWVNSRDCGGECGKDYGKDYRKLTVNLKIRKGEVWGSDNGNGVRNRWVELGKDVREVIGSVGEERFLDMARKTSELMKYVEEKYGVEKVEEIQREVENGNRRIRECKKEIEGIIGGNGKDGGCWSDDGMDGCDVSEGYDSENMEEAMVKMEEVVGEVEERLKEVMGEEIWERYRGIIGEE